MTCLYFFGRRFTASTTAVSSGVKGVSGKSASRPVVLRCQALRKKLLQRLMVTRSSQAFSCSALSNAGFAFT